MSGKTNLDAGCSVGIVVAPTRLSDGSKVWDCRIVQGEHSVHIAAHDERSAWVVARAVKSALIRSLETVGEIIHG